MTHIAIVEQLDGKTTDWMEKVSNAQYGALVQAQRSTPAAPTPNVPGNVGPPTP
jgi:4-carboxymuconolactone decarboxylase